MKSVKNIIVLLLIGASLLSCQKETAKKYALSTEEVLEAYLKKDDILTVEKLANILLCKHEHNYRFIDLRTPPEFIQNHLEGAINVPAKDVLDIDNFDILNQDEYLNVLYCRGGSQAINVYMILKQLGFKNIKVALGGFDFINNSIIEEYGIKSGDYDEEKPKYDYLRMVVGVDQPVFDSIKAPEVKVKNPNKVIRDFDEMCPDLN